MADDGEVLGFGALFSFEGRLNRGGFWKVFLLCIIGVVVLGMVAAIVIPKVATSGGGEPGSSSGGMGALVVMGLVYLLAAWVSLATYAKRWHDLDKSAWMVLLSLIPLVNLLVFLYLGFAPGSEGPNRFGAGPQKILF